MSDLVGNPKDRFSRVAGSSIHTYIAHTNVGATDGSLFLHTGKHVRGTQKLLFFSAFCSFLMSLNLSIWVF